MIVCHCAGMTDSAIARLIDAGARSVGEIARLSGAGRCCAPCREEIAGMIPRDGGRTQEANRGTADPQTAAL